MASRSGTMGVSSFPSSPSHFSSKARASSSISLIPSRLTTSRRSITCCVQESSTSTSTIAADAKEVKSVEEKAETPPSSPPPPPAKAKPAAKAKAVVKPLPELMEEDVIPSLKAILETEQHLIQLQLSFNDNTLEGSFKKNEIPYSFWAFFPDGLAGPKGFATSAYGSEVSTVEPFLIDEKKITGKLIVFWVQKRLAAQGII
ncbi:uncharacterized protein LOC126655370 isoform X2 [Mercurialis annua]|uniref:uncharacterized protein LOC126655370 isoform X2 n=1 Tax=Mercurialis annua TaxID=3986 RepID=UPI00215F2C68|nr:uncharacterized protein LOC126655370 isoform X2 [Mercurialis annua]